MCYRLLQTDPELFQTYKDIVVSGVISPEEFWLSHSSVSFVYVNVVSQQKCVSLLWSE